MEVCHDVRSYDNHSRVQHERTGAHEPPKAAKERVTREYP